MTHLIGKLVPTITLNGIHSEVKVNFGLNEDKQDKLDFYVNFE